MDNTKEKIGENENKMGVNLESEIEELGINNKKEIESLKVRDKGIERNSMPLTHLRYPKLQYVA